MHRGIVEEHAGRRVTGNRLRAGDRGEGVGVAQDARHILAGDRPDITNFTTGMSWRSCAKSRYGSPEKAPASAKAGLLSLCLGHGSLRLGLPGGLSPSEPNSHRGDAEECAGAATKSRQEAGMTEPISPKQFYEADGIEDWRLVGSDGACTYFPPGRSPPGRSWYVPSASWPGSTTTGSASTCGPTA